MSCGNFEEAGKALIKKFCSRGQREPIHRKARGDSFDQLSSLRVALPYRLPYFFSCSSRPLDSPG
jgi:hypothetical protein